FVGGQHRNDATPIGGGPHQVRDLEGPLTEERLAALLLEHQQGALDGADGGGGDIAVGSRNLLRALADFDQQRPQVLEVEKQQPLVVGELEGDVEDAFLDVVEVQYARKQQRPHLRYRGANRVPLPAEQVPEDGGAALLDVVLEADLGSALCQRLTVLAGDGDAGEIALDVGAEDRHPGPRKSFRHDLQADRLAGAGGTRDQAVAVGIAEGEVLRPGAGAEVDLVVDEHVASGGW